MASANELMETEDIHSPNSVEDISSSSDSSPVSFNDGTIAHKEIKNCDENEEENSNFENTNFTRTGSNIESSNTDDISYGERDRSNEENDPLTEESTFLDESNSGEHDIFGSVENKQVNIDGDNPGNTIISSPQESNSDSENNVSDDDVLDIDVDAPVPSPFSDIGDISGPENAMISDILKETNNARDISPVLDGFAENFDSINASLHDGDAGNEVDNGANENAEKHSDNKDDDEDDDDDSNDQEDNDKGDGNDHDQAIKAQENTNKPGEPQEQRGYVGGLIADIFGDTDEEDEEEEFKGFHEEELQTERLKLSAHSDSRYDESKNKDDNSEDASDNDSVAAEEEADDDDDVEPGDLQEPEDEVNSNKQASDNKVVMLSDFDLMMKRKKQAMGQRRRRKSDSEAITEVDDIIAAMVQNMHEAVEEDRMLNQAGRAATKKLKMLDTVVSHIHKADLQRKFIDGGVLPVMKEWLSPLPDNSLPHIMIRKQFLRLLSEFPPLNAGALKMSGIGRAVMLLYKHPKETRENRNLAGKIVAQWARPIFGVQTTFKDISKEEREERDKCNAAEFKRRRLSSADDSLSSDAQEDKRPKRPGDKGFIARARVPKPSNRDYIVRPRSDLSLGEIGSIKGQNPKKTLNRFEKQMRKYKERKGLKTAATRAVTISVNGSKMAL